MSACVIDVRVGFTLQIKRQVFLDGYASNLRVSYPEHLTALASLFAGSIEFTMSVSPPLMSLFSAVSYFGTLVLVHEKQLIIFFCLDSCFSSTRFSKISIILMCTLTLHKCELLIRQENIAIKVTRMEQNMQRESHMLDGLQSSIYYYGIPHGHVLLSPCVSLNEGFRCLNKLIWLWSVELG